MLNWTNTKVTVELRDVIAGGVDIWAFDYPSYYKGDEKTAFEKKVIDHFYFRQIGQETVGMFLHYFRTKMREIMPYYIDLYKSVELFKSIEDPLQSYDLTETFEKSGTLTQNDTGSSTRKYSDTPQGSIENIETYMSEATKDSATNNSDASSTESYTLRRFGNIGVQPLGDEIKKLQDAYINIDMMIINELKDLFLKVY